MRALAKDPAARYQSAVEMEAALVEANRASHPLTNEPTRTLPPVVETSALPPARPPIHTQSLPPEERRRSRRWLLVPAVAALCVLLALAGVFAFRSAGGGHAATEAPTKIAIGPQASAITVATVSPTPAPLLTATQAPQLVPTLLPTVAPTIAPTAPAPSPTPLAVPTATPLPAPTATTALPTAALTATPPAVVGGASSPAQAVQLFYQYAGQHQFDAAAQLWTSQMRAQFPPAGNINGHFGQDQRVEATIGTVTMTGDSQATVAVDVTEFRDGATVRSVGSWQVVRGPSGWLLNQPDLRQA